jgi:hypothetical protein
MKRVRVVGRRRVLGGEMRRGILLLVGSIATTTRKVSERSKQPIPFLCELFSACCAFSRE